MKTTLSTAVATGFLCMALTAQASDAADWPHARVIAASVAATSGSAEVVLNEFGQVRAASNATLSRNGKIIAFEMDAAGIPQLWAIPATGGKPRQLIKGGPVRDFHWTPDSSKLVVRSDVDGNERHTYSLISADGAEATPLKGTGQGLSRFGDFSSDGSAFIFASTAKGSDEYAFYIQALEGGAAKRVFNGKGEWIPHAWQPGGDYVVVTHTRGEDRADLHLFNTKTETMVSIYEPADPARFHAFAWTKDGAGFYMATSLNRDFKALAYYDLTSGELTRLEAPAADIEQISLGGGNRYIAWLVNEGGDRALTVRDLKKNRLVNLPDVPRGMYEIELAQDAPVLQISIKSPRISGDVWTYNFETQSLIQVTRSNTAARPSAKAKEEVVKGALKEAQKALIAAEIARDSALKARDEVVAGSASGNSQAKDKQAVTVSAEKTPRQTKLRDVDPREAVDGALQAAEKALADAEKARAAALTALKAAKAAPQKTNRSALPPPETSFSAEAVSGAAAVSLAQADAATDESLAQQSALATQLTDVQSQAKTEAAAKAKAEQDVKRAAADAEKARLAAETAAAEKAAKLKDLEAARLALAEAQAAEDIAAAALEPAEEQLEDQQAAIRDAEQGLDDANESIADTQVILEKAQSDKTEAEEMLEEAVSVIAESQETLADAASAKAKAQSDLETAQAKKAKLETALAGREKAAAEAAKTAQAAQARVDALVADITAEGADADKSMMEKAGEAASQVIDKMMGKSQ
ncbi:MAG: hypothetical protein AAF221_13085 [Pseudomonadota bacterium]